MTAADAASAPANPLFEISPLPFELPPFADITLEHCREAILDGMVPMRRDGMLKVRQGIVTPLEIVRSAGNPEDY